MCLFIGIIYICVYLYVSFIYVFIYRYHLYRCLFIGIIYIGVLLYSFYFMYVCYRMWLWFNSVDHSFLILTITTLTRSFEPSPVSVSLMLSSDVDIGIFIKTPSHPWRAICHWGLRYSNHKSSVLSSWRCGYSCVINLYVFASFENGSLFSSIDYDLPF